MFVLCFLFFVIREIMVDSVKLVEVEDVWLYIYLVEILDEENFCLKMFGMCMVDYLESVGWLSDRIWFVYGIYFN